MHIILNLCHVEVYIVRTVENHVGNIPLENARLACHRRLQNLTVHALTTKYGIIPQVQYSQFK